MFRVHKPMFKLKKHGTYMLFDNVNLECKIKHYDELKSTKHINNK